MQNIFLSLNLSSGVNLFKTSSNIGFHYIYYNVPNIKEVVLSTPYKAIIDTILGNFIGGDNPASNSIIRDTTKIIDMFFLVRQNISMGNRKVKYDVGNLLGSTSKLAIKFSTIYALRYAGYSLETACLVSNYPGDIVTRFFQISSEERQKVHKGSHNCTYQEYAEFVYNNWKISWVNDAIFTGLFRAITVNKIGNLIKFLKIPSSFNYLNYITEIYLLYGEANLDAKNLHKTDLPIWQKIESSDNKLTALCFAFFPKVIIRFAAEFTNSLLIGTPARIASHSLSDLIKWTQENNVTETIENYYISFTGKEDYNDYDGF